MAFASLLLANATMAQEIKKKNSSPVKTEQQRGLSECCMMKDGKMYHYMDGKESLIEQETTFHGMQVWPDGTCKMKNGKTMKLKEGECCDRKGMVHTDCQEMLKKS